MAKGQTGGSLGGRTILSERRRKARARARQREEERWASLSGPVTVSYVEPSAPLLSVMPSDPGPTV